jgi:O-antigen ligase
VTIQGFLFPLLVLLALLVSQISPAYVVFGLLTLLWFLEMRRRGQWARSFGSPLVALAGLQALLLVLSTLFSRDAAVSARHLAGVSLLLLLPITIDLLDDPSKARVVFCALGANGVLLSLVGFWQFAHGGNDIENRIRGTLSHTMTFSGLTMATGCLLLGFAFEERSRWRWVGLAAAVPLTAMMLTFTRNTYVGLLAALLVYPAVRRPRALLLLAPAVLAVFLIVPPEIRGRIRSIVDLKELTNRDRIAMAHAGLRMITDFPILGLGPEMVKRYYVLYRDNDALFFQVPHLHNNALQVAAQSGLFAAAAYLALMGLFFARTIRLLRREDRPDRAALLAGALLAGTALFVAGFFEYNWGDTEVEMATLLVLAVPFSPSTAGKYWNADRAGPVTPGPGTDNAVG